MTLAQLGLVLWDDLAAPVIAGRWVSACLSGSMRPNGAAGVTTCGLFRCIAATKKFPGMRLAPRVMAECGYPIGPVESSASRARPVRRNVAGA